MASAVTVGQIQFTKQSDVVSETVQSRQHSTSVQLSGAHSVLSIRACCQVCRPRPLLRKPPERRHCPSHLLQKRLYLTQKAIPSPIQVRRTTRHFARPLASSSINTPARDDKPSPSKPHTHFENQPPPIYPTPEEESAGPSGHPGYIFFSGDSRVGTVSYNPQATVQGTPPPEQEIGDPPNMTMGTELPPKRLLLMAVLAGTLWTSLMGVRVFGRGARVAAGAVSLVWLGIVLGISFLEAWVKFRAPLITRAVAVDVGRHVFAAKSYVEKLLYLALVALLADAGVRPWGPPFVVPVLMAVVLLQWEWLEPGLEQRARWTIAQAPKEDLPASKASIQASIAESVIEPVPKRDIHEIFGALEVVKALVLVSLAVWALKGSR